MAGSREQRRDKGPVINNPGDQLDQDADRDWRRAGGGPEAHDEDTSTEQPMRPDEARHPAQDAPMGAAAPAPPPTATTPDVTTPQTDNTGRGTPGPSVGAVDVAHGQVRNQPGDTAPRRAGGQGPDQPRSLGSAGGGATGPGSSTIHEPPER